jgi:hypothetical protein
VALAAADASGAAAQQTAGQEGGGTDAEPVITECSGMTVKRYSIARYCMNRAEGRLGSPHCLAHVSFTA